MGVTIYKVESAGSKKPFLFMVEHSDDELTHRKGKGGNSNSRSEPI